MTWPPATDEEKRACHRRQLAVADALEFIETFRPLPLPPEPVTDEERAKLRKLRDEALRAIEAFRPRRREWL